MTGGHVAPCSGLPPLRHLMAGGHADPWRSKRATGTAWPEVMWLPVLFCFVSPGTAWPAVMRTPGGPSAPQAPHDRRSCGSLFFVSPGTAWPAVMRTPGGPSAPQAPHDRRSCGSLSFFLFHPPSPQTLHGRRSCGSSLGNQLQACRD